MSAVASTTTTLSRIESKISDIHALKARGVSLEILTPKVEARLREGYTAVKPLSGTILWQAQQQDFVIQLMWPLAYPDEEANLIQL